MRVIANRRGVYTVQCECSTTFRVETVRLTFECPSCGTAASAAEVISDFILSGGDRQTARV